MRNQGMTKKATFIADLEKAGFTLDQANLAFDTMMSTLTEGITSGNRVILSRNITLNCEVFAPESVERFGKTQEQGWRVVIKVRKSRVLKEAVRLKHDPQAKLDAQMADLAKKVKK